MTPSVSLGLLWPFLFLLCHRTEGSNPTEPPVPQPGRAWVPRQDCASWGCCRPAALGGGLPGQSLPARPPGPGVDWGLVHGKASPGSEDKMVPQQSPGWAEHVPFYWMPAPGAVPQMPRDQGQHHRLLAG